VSVLVSPISWEFYRVLLLLPAAHVLTWLRGHHFPVLPSAAAILIGCLLVPPLDAWVALARVPSTTWGAPEGEPLSAVAALLSLGPAVGVAALGYLQSRLAEADASLRDDGRAGAVR
jgi:hypothetical protein